MRQHGSLIDGLNEALRDELAAVGHDMVQAEMNRQSGHERSRQIAEARAKDEMHHAERLIARIVTLGGTPAVTEREPIGVGGDLRPQIESDLAHEQGTTHLYNKLLDLAARENDDQSEELLATILGDEERHIRVLRTLDAQMGSSDPFGAKADRLGERS